MCGVPYHSCEAYISRLVEKGYKVAICEQTSEPSNRGIVKRDVVRVVTPGTVIENSMLDESKNNFICSVFKLKDEIIKNDISVKDDINYLLEVGATMNIHIIMSTDSVLDEDINYLFDKDDISKLSFYLTTRREYNKFLDNYIDESLGRDGIYVSTNSTLTRISLPLIEDDEITRVVDNLEVNI